MSTFSPNYNNDTIRLSTESFTSSVPENREHMVSSQNIKNLKILKNNKKGTFQIKIILFEPNLKKRVNEKNFLFKTSL